MKSLCVLLAVAVIQGAIGQEDFFSVEPTSHILPEGETVTLECVTREPANPCAWTVYLPDMGFPIDGFLNIHTETIERLGLRVRDPSSTTDCSIIIDSIEKRHGGNYTCAPYKTGGGQISATPSAVITVAVKPASVGFTGDLATASELTANSNEDTIVTCEARDARPAAELRWFLGESPITEGVVPDEKTDQATRLVTSLSTLTHRFASQDEGAELRCEAVHPAYEDLDVKEAALTVVVQFAPTHAEGPDLGTLYGFTEGEDKDLAVNFTSNPAPAEIQWTVGAETLADGEQSGDGHIIAGTLETLDAASHQYSVKLTFSPVQAEDLNNTFHLRLVNAVGERDFHVRVEAAAPPPKATVAPQPTPEGGVSGGAIGGIIVAVIALLALIALVAFARSRGKWCFAGKRSDAGAEALVTKRKEGDVESAANKDETKELTAPDGEGSPKREQPEVVYAELVLDKDGVKTEVRPSPEKTEYAVIVGTKTPEAKE